MRAVPRRNTPSHHHMRRSRHRLHPMRYLCLSDNKVFIQDERQTLLGGVYCQDYRRRERKSWKLLHTDHDAYSWLADLQNMDRCQMDTPEVCETGDADFLSSVMGMVHCLRDSRFVPSELYLGYFQRWNQRADPLHDFSHCAPLAMANVCCEMGGSTSQKHEQCPKNCQKRSYCTPDTV